MNKNETNRRLVELAQGVLIEEDVLGIIARIQEYDPNLSVQYLDPDQTDLTDAPYRIMELCPDGHRRVVFTTWSLDERVMERLFAADQARGNALVGIERANERAQRAVERRYRDEQDAINEMVVDVLKSPKDTFSATNPVTGEKHTFRSVRQSKR